MQIDHVMATIRGISFILPAEKEVALTKQNPDSPPQVQN